MTATLSITTKGEENLNKIILSDKKLRKILNQIKRGSKGLKITVIKVKKGAKTYSNSVDILEKPIEVFLKKTYNKLNKKHKNKSDCLKNLFNKLLKLRGLSSEIVVRKPIYLTRTQTAYIYALHLAKIVEIRRIPTLTIRKRASEHKFFTYKTYVCVPKTFPTDYLEFYDLFLSRLAEILYSRGKIRVVITERVLSLKLHTSEFFRSLVWKYSGKYRYLVLSLIVNLIFNPNKLKLSLKELSEKIDETLQKIYETKKQIFEEFKSLKPIWEIVNIIENKIRKLRELLTIYFVNWVYQYLEVFKEIGPPPF